MISKSEILYHLKMSFQAYISKLLFHNQNGSRPQDLVQDQYNGNDHQLLRSPTSNKKLHGVVNRLIKN